MQDEKIENDAMTQPNHADKPPRLPWRFIGILCSLFSIVVLIVVGGYAGWGLMRVNTQLAASVVQTNNQLQQLQSDFNSLKTETTLMQQTTQQSADEIKILTKNITDLSQEKQGNQEKWLLFEARYYVKWANENLQFLHNVPMAIFLLKLADQGISHLADPKMAEIRKAIATDLANLQGVPQVDIAGLYMKLAVLNNQLDQLPLQAKQSNLQEPKPSITEQKQTIWQRGLHAAWQALQNLVVIRYNSKGQMPLIMPEQQAFLYQNLHAMLAQSIWALLNRQPDIYQSSLQQLTVWIERYFALDAPMTRAVLTDLTQLEKTDIHPPVPTLANTLQAFNGV